MRLIAICLLVTASAHAAAPASPRELQERFQRALAAKDLRALVQLYEWRDVSPSMRTTTAMMLDELTRKEIKSIELGRVTQKRETIVQGIRYRPNLPLAGAVVVTYVEKGVTDKVEIPYGRQANGYYFSAVIEEPVAPPPATPRWYGLSVGGTAAPQPAQFSGFYVAVVNGKEVRKEFSGQAGLTKQIRADSLRYCEVRKTSEGGQIYLLITANGETLYESPPTDTATPITYGGR
jgi:hypothetical protein